MPVAYEKLTSKGRATRERIVAAASELMLQHGVARTTIEDIQDAAAISTSQMYHYFTDKNDLVSAVIDFQTDQMLDCAAPGPGSHRKHRGLAPLARHHGRHRARAGRRWRLPARIDGQRAVRMRSRRAGAARAVIRPVGEHDSATAWSSDCYTWRAGQGNGRRPCRAGDARRYPGRTATQPGPP